MNHEHFKSLLQRDKTFLKELYESNSKAKSKNILNFATDAELNTLAKYFYFVSNGIIPIKKQNFDAIDKKNVSFVKKHFEKKAAVQRITQASRKEKLRIFSKVVVSFNHFLAPLFVE